MVRPWLFLLPALIALGLYLAYPVYETLRLSVTERVPGGGYDWAGAENYQRMAGDPKFWEALRNNMLWLIVVPALSTAFGLLVAQLTDRIRWGAIAKSLIFMPMAISFVGASVIWKLVYDTRPEGQEQIGILNAVYIWFGGTDPQTWLTIPFWNNFFLMVVLVWIQTGFAMVILSAALRGIPEETVEAAIVDGANPFPDLLQNQGAADPDDDPGGLDDDHDHRSQSLRHRLRHDQRSVGDAGSRQLHVRQAVPRQRLGGRLGGGHGDHAPGHADPRLERAQRAQRDALRGRRWTISQAPNPR